MATIHDLIELTEISPDTTYSLANGNLLGVVDGASSADLDDGEFDEGDSLTIGGVTYTIDRIQEPSSTGRFTLAGGTERSFNPASESNLDVVFLTVSNGTVVRHFIIPNDSYGDMDIAEIRTGSLIDVAGSDAAIISTANNDVGVVCFASGTLIAVAGGRCVPVESLSRRDLVLTADRGLQPVRRIEAQRVDAGVLARQPDLRPIRIRAGALGPGSPDRDLVLSPQHRVLVASRIAERMFGAAEVLVAAKHLLGAAGVELAESVAEVTYVHLLLDRHEILAANGALCESLLLGDMAVDILTGGQGGGPLRGITHRGEGGNLLPCRPLLPGRLARKLVARHRKNVQPLCARAGLAMARGPRAAGCLQSGHLPLPLAAASFSPVV